MIRGFLRRLGAGLALLPTLAAQAGTVTYFHNDLAGSPVAATNEQKQVVWRESYRPYGERLTNSPAASGNDIWFTSRRQDAETGLVYMGARYYDPVAGRFVSTDPAGFDEGNVHSFNRYAYANNNPNRYMDPDGRSPLGILAPPPRLPSAPPPPLAGGKSEAQQIRNLEGFSSGATLPRLSIPAFGIGDAINFAFGGVPEIVQGLGAIFNSSPVIEPRSVAGRSPDQIDQLAQDHGLIPRGPDPKGGRGAYVDPVTGEQRIVCHANCRPPHAHVNDSSGNRLDIDGNRVRQESPRAHLPIRTEQ